MKRANCAGFTIVEVLVVVGIVGLLAALLLPAVQAAREAARRARCANNLRQIGLAIRLYHDTWGSFPPGNVTRTKGICRGDALAGVGYPSEDGSNWSISILPFVEQRALYEQYDFNEFNEAARNRKVREAFVPTYVCPSDASTEQLLVPASGPACAPALNLAYRPGSYRAMCGRSDGRQFIDSDAFQNYPDTWRGAMHTIGIGNLTVERYANVTDGLSRTIVAGESTTCTNPSFRTFWAYSYGHYSLSSATPQSRTLLGDYDACVKLGGIGGSLPCRRGWGSYHPNGAMYLLGDGAVRFLSTAIDVNLFAALATIGGDEASSD
jgi:prepilin-type N-terminal cleavage/methylation domain-containing protein